MHVLYYWADDISSTGSTISNFWNSLYICLILLLCPDITLRQCRGISPRVRGPSEPSGLSQRGCAQAMVKGQRWKVLEREGVIAREGPEERRIDLRMRNLSLSY